MATGLFRCSLRTQNAPIYSMRHVRSIFSHSHMKYRWCRFLRYGKVIPLKPLRYPRLPVFVQSGSSLLMKPTLSNGVRTLGRRHKEETYGGCWKKSGKSSRVNLNIKPSLVQAAYTSNSSFTTALVHQTLYRSHRNTRLRQPTFPIIPSDTSEQYKPPA